MLANLHVLDLYIDSNGLFGELIGHNLLLLSLLPRIILNDDVQEQQLI